MDQAALENYLREKMGNDIRVSRMSRSQDGLSRETWFVTLSDRKIVVRSNLPGNVASCPVTLDFEYAVYDGLVNTVVPVARPLWYESDTTILGREFYIREFIDGSPYIANFEDPDPRFDELRIEVAKEHARKMALVHTLDWKSTSFGGLMVPPSDARYSALAAIDRIETTFRGIQLEPLPLIEYLLDWLRDNAPVSRSPIALCKGSNGSTQEVWRDGLIVAMADWELASLGDPASDWARCTGYVTSLPERWNARDLYDYYETLSGIHIDENALKFYQLLYLLELTIVGYCAALPIVSGKYPDSRLCYIATAAVHSCLSKLARAAKILK